MKKQGRSKYYLVLSAENKYTHGAFPYTEEGLEAAQKYVEKSSKKLNEKLIIEERP